MRKETVPFIDYGVIMFLHLPQIQSKDIIYFLKNTDSLSITKIDNQVDHSNFTKKKKKS